MGKSVCSRANRLYLESVVAFGQSGCIKAKVVVFGQSGCIWGVWLLSGKVVVFGQSGFITSKGL